MMTTRNRDNQETELLGCQSRSGDGDRLRGSRISLPPGDPDRDLVKDRDLQQCTTHVQLIVREKLKTIKDYFKFSVHSNNNKQQHIYFILK